MPDTMQPSATRYRPIKSGLWSLLDPEGFVRCGDFPEVPCVYALFRWETIAYVGQTQNLRNRLQAHCHFQYGKDFDKVQIVYLEDAKERETLEIRLIALLEPPLNRSRPNRKHPALRSKLPRSYR